MRVFFSTNWSFRVSLKNSCNKNFLKVSVSAVGEIKMWAVKQGIHSKGFPENKKIFNALNIPAFKRPQLLTKHT